jgi:hypothetical protein
VNEAGGFRDSEYKILLKVAKPAFALSSLPLAFCFVQAKKKSDNTTIEKYSKENRFRVLLRGINLIDYTLTFLRRKKSKQKSSSNGFEVGGYRLLRFHSIYL